MNTKLLCILFFVLQTVVMAEIPRYGVEDVLIAWNSKIEKNLDEIQDQAIDAQDKGDNRQYLELSKKMDQLDDLSDLLSEKSL
ncbi:MAG: hypothetical protein GY909_08210 [Oligoflexia bacterium]|nr:hypothetical protein [Oligoflexia bacterium]